jgi:hypothetical protein
MSNEDNGRLKNLVKAREKLQEKRVRKDLIRTTRTERLNEYTNWRWSPSHWSPATKECYINLTKSIIASRSFHQSRANITGDDEDPLIIYLTRTITGRLSVEARFDEYISDIDSSDSSI